MGNGKSKHEGEGSKRKRTFFSNRKKVKVKGVKGKSSGGVKSAKISKPETPASSWNGDGFVHPLLIYQIIERIFQYIICPTTNPSSEKEAERSVLVAKNVQNFRLVCKEWKYEATRLYLRNRARIMSFGFGRMQNFLDVMKSSDLIPIQRYEISYFPKKNQQLMKDFMLICGHHAVELKLPLYCTCGIELMEFSPPTLPDLNLMNLKKLSLISHECNGNSDNLIETFLRAAGALREFDFQLWPYHLVFKEEHLVNGLVERFVEFICKRIPKTVEILRLDMPVSDFYFSILTEGELKLKEFEFNCRSVRNARSCKVIRKFFEKQAATLKYLNITDRGPVVGRRPPPGSLDFPRLDELLHLELVAVTIHKFSWPDTFPKLTTLNIAKWNIESTCLELFSSAKKGLSLKEIHLPYRFSLAPIVNKAAQLFPNISKLYINEPLDISETLQKIFISLPNLEELYISFLSHTSLNLDSLFSGVTEQDCRAINNLRSCNFDNVNIKGFQHQPSILNLTKLKKLVLYHFRQIILTDFTAHFVFLKMASLKELHTKGFYLYETMSTKYLKLLKQKLTLQPPHRGGLRLNR